MNYEMCEDTHIVIPPIPIPFGERLPRKSGFYDLLDSLVKLGNNNTILDFSVNPGNDKKHMQVIHG